MIFITFNRTGLAICLVAGFLAVICEIVLFHFRPNLYESYGTLPTMVAGGVFMVVLDICYRLTLGKRSKEFEDAENSHGVLLDRRCGGHVSCMPVWLSGGIVVVGTLFKIFGSDPDFSAQASVSQKSSYASTYSYSPEPSYRSLKLGMISGVASNRIATINGQPFAQGESHTLTIDSTKRVVQCTEIREQSVVLTIAGDSQPRELKIGEPLVPNGR